MRTLAPQPEIQHSEQAQTPLQGNDEGTWPGAVLWSWLCVRPTPHALRRCPHSEGPRVRAQLLTGTGTGASCTCGPGALVGWLEGSRCRSPESWSCSQSECRTRWFCVPLETKPQETERLPLHAPRKGIRSRLPRSVRTHVFISHLADCCQGKSSSFSDEDV